MRKSMKIAAGILCVLILAAAVYLGDYYKADENSAALHSDEVVTVVQEENLVSFLPAQTDTGLIFYPGGKVEHTAYAPLMRQLANQGILCVLIKMPFHLAVLDRNAADGITEKYPDVDNWYMAGHSLGGSMAASHVSKYTDMYEGLILLASYSTAELQDTTMEVLSVYGSEDQVLNMEKYEECKVNLPSGFQEHIIQGGCHAGFGNYGVQKGDGVPSITTQEQQMQTVHLILELLS